MSDVKDSRRDAERRRAQSVGNMAKMRAALILCVDSARCIANHAGFSSRIASEALVIVNAAADALAAPARNCDVIDNPYDAADAWPDNEMCAGRRHYEGTCNGCKYSPARCVAKWLYDVAKKKRGDESPRTEQEGEVQG